MSEVSLSRRNVRTSSRKEFSSSVNSRRMVAAGVHGGVHGVFCTTEFNSKLVQNYEYRCPSLSMNKPPKAPLSGKAKPPHKAAGARTPAGRRAKQPKADRHFVTALARGLEVLACYRHGDRVLGNQELSQRCGLAKSTVSRLTHTLTQLGYLIYVEDSAKYG